MDIGGCFRVRLQCDGEAAAGIQAAGRKDVCSAGIAEKKDPVRCTDGSRVAGEAHDGAFHKAFGIGHSPACRIIALDLLQGNPGQILTIELASIVQIQRCAVQQTSGQIEGYH